MSNQFQNPNFEGQSPSTVPSTGPEVVPQRQPVSPQEAANNEVLSRLDSQALQPMQAQEPVAQPETPEIKETDDPLEYIRNNTPGNLDTPAVQTDPEISQQPKVATAQEATSQPPITSPETEKKDSQEELREEIDSLKNILLAFLEGGKVDDLTVWPKKFLKPRVDPPDSGRRMFKPLGIETVQFGYIEFKKALENAMTLDENTYILKYVSERPREGGRQPQPILLKCNKEQVDAWKSEIERTEQQTQIAGQQYQQAPITPQQLSQQQ